MNNHTDIAKRYLKAELVRRGLSTMDLVDLLSKVGVSETKASIDSKISRGSFSASFFLQCLSIIGCNKLEIDSSSGNVYINEVNNRKSSNDK